MIRQPARLWMIRQPARLWMIRQTARLWMIQQPDRLRTMHQLARLWLWINKLLNCTPSNRTSCISSESKSKNNLSEYII